MTHKAENIGIVVDRRANLTDALQGCLKASALIGHELQRNDDMDRNRRNCFATICQRPGWVLLSLVAFSMASCSQSTTPWVPEDFEAPTRFIHAEFQLHRLNVKFNEADYEAVMESKVRLRSHFGGEWPKDDFTLADNQKDIIEHEQAFDERTAFTYSIFSADGQKLIGCVYLFPGDRADVEILFWIRDTANTVERSFQIQQELSAWIIANWPFKTFTFYEAPNQESGIETQPDSEISENGN